MKTAKDLYGTNKYPLFNSLSTAAQLESAMTQLYSSCGSNRKGVYNPFGWTYAHNNSGNFSFRETQQYLTQLSPKLEWFDWIYTNQMSPVLKQWFADGSQGAGDIYFPVCNIIDTVTFSNYNQFIPVEYSVYICQCKRDTNLPPTASWYSDGYASATTQMPGEYTYPTASSVITDPDQAASDISIYSETSVHVGSTPYFSRRISDELGSTRCREI
jgi:hypothetical protein